MKILFDKMNDYNFCKEKALTLNGVYEKNVIFHCFWNGDLNEKHLYSIKSCYYFNVLNNRHKIVLWLENNKPNEINEEISKYCEIKDFIIKNETTDNFLHNQLIVFKGPKSEKSNYYRMVLLYNYGGCWFDLDCFFLRSFDPLFCNFGNEICLYGWRTQPYPNNAIFISLEPKSTKMKKNMEYIISLGLGWGFQRVPLTYDLPMDITVLPYIWFDVGWINNPTTNQEFFMEFFTPTQENITIDSFFPGSFCYHWHNKWNGEIQKNSPMMQLCNDLDKKLSHQA